MSLLRWGLGGGTADQTASRLTARPWSGVGVQMPLSHLRLCQCGGQESDSFYSPREFQANVSFAETRGAVTCSCLWKQRCGLKP